ncbi:flagellar filament capping protein FliD [Arthrobacter sp. CAN_A1]|uniref:flagellar filament capping protein FliD n=1 Tax=Arthrobacter sp. CAN_A1 TaxID=2787717 RepID=UPI0018CA1420
MALGIDGLASGLDTTTLINQLMQLEGRPQVLLKNRVGETQTLVTALQQLNTRVASLGAAAEKAALPAAFNVFKATASSTNVTTTAGSAASAGSLDITVDRLAQNQVSVTAAMTAWPDSPPVITVTTADGTATEITAATTSLDDLVSAINASDSGITAVKVASGVNAANEPQYRLQLSSEAAGADGGFTVHRGTAADTTTGTAANLLTEPGAAEVKTAQDSQVTLWAGTAAAQSVTSSSNTFTNLLPGVDVTAAKVSTDPVTITVARDQAATTKTAKDLVDAVAGALGYIATNSSVTTSESTGSSVATAGLFTGDSGVRGISARILSAATAPVDGRSPSDIGITLTRTGTVEFDSEKFGKALAADPAAVQSMLKEIASRVAGVAKDTSDKFDGAITLRIQGQESEVKELNTQVAEWDRRLETRRSTLERTYTNLELQLNQLQSQGTWLTSQLANLPRMESSRS